MFICDRIFPVPLKVLMSFSFSKGFESTIQEIRAQAEDLIEYSKYLKRLGIKKQNPEETLFCGAGDSYACALFVERFENFKPRAFDPAELFQYPQAAKDKNVYFISVSGRTKANIEAARRVRNLASRRVAITVNPESSLAKTCDDIIELKFTKSQGLTPGTNSFTACVLACSALFSDIPRLDVRGILRRAELWSQNLELKGDYYHFVGSGPFYGLCVYGAAKIFEFTGFHSSYQLTEEFSHLDLFSLGGKRNGSKKKDLIFILRSEPKEERSRELHDLLSKEGVESFLVPTSGRGSTQSEILERSISYSIYLQYLGLSAALQTGLSKPSFLLEKSLLRISDRLIYEQS